MHNITQKALHNIMDASNLEVAEVRSRYEQEVRNLTDFVYNNAMAFLRSREVRDLQANVTKIYDDFVFEAEKILDNKEQIESKLRAMVDEFVDIGFFRDDSAEATPEADDEVVKTKRVVYRWQGDVEAVLQSFLNQLYDLGEDPETNTLSIYGLAEKLGNDVKALVDLNLEKVSGFNYTFDDAKQALLETVKIEENEFSRDVIFREMSKMIDGVAELYGYDERINVTQSITDTMDWVEYKLRDYSDGAIPRIPGRVFVAPMIVLDYVLGQVRLLVNLLGAKEFPLSDDPLLFTFSFIVGSRDHHPGRGFWLLERGSRRQQEEEGWLHLFEGKGHHV